MKQGYTSHGLGVIFLGIIYLLKFITLPVWGPLWTIGYLAEKFGLARGERSIDRW